MKKIKVILIGAGGRGCTYTHLMDKEKFEIIGVAEPIQYRREKLRDRFNIPEENCFYSHKEILSVPKFADAAIIATTDREHYEPAMMAIEKGYDLLLEKPVAPTYQECIDIAKAAKEKNVKVLVCHVLRYTKFFLKLKEILKNNDIGKIISIQACENVGHLHHSHSYVRGNWGNEQKSANMLLAKSCHDIDILQWLLDEKCVNVQSFGSLSHFKEENAPEGAPEYCYQDCPHRGKCYYDATVIYTKDHPGWYKSKALQKSNATEEDYKELIRTTQYGKCVYKCDNDVVDHQVVNLEFESGALVSFMMASFNEGGRTIHIMGTDGEINANMATNSIDFFSFKTGEHTLIKPNELDIDDSITSGHGGGDGGIVEMLYKYLAENYEGEMLSEIGISVQNHLIVFAAEKSRKENKVVNMDEYYKEIGF